MLQVQSNVAGHAMSSGMPDEYFLEQERRGLFQVSYIRVEDQRKEI